MKNTIHSCIIATDERGECVLLKCTPDRGHDLDIFEGFYLDDHVKNKDAIPTDFGIYTCQIEVSYFKYNYIVDGYGADLTRTLSNLKRVDISSVELLPKVLHDRNSFKLNFVAIEGQKGWICKYYSKNAKRIDRRLPHQYGFTIEEAASKMVAYMREHYPAMLQQD